MGRVWQRRLGAKAGGAVSRSPVEVPEDLIKQWSGRDTAGIRGGRGSVPCGPHLSLGVSHKLNAVHIYVVLEDLCPVKMKRPSTLFERAE